MKMNEFTKKAREQNTEIANKSVYTNELQLTTPQCLELANILKYYHYACERETNREETRAIYYSDYILKMIGNEQI